MWFSVGRSSTPHPVQRNLDPALHPFSRAREYTRAVNAAKMDRMFSKPFVGALEGHVDGVYTLAKDPRRVGVVAGGGGDGEVIVHSLSLRRPILKLPQAHRGMVTGLAWSAHARDTHRSLISCSSTDASIKVWRSPLIAGHLANAGVEGEDDGGFESNAYGQAGENGLATGMMDADQREVEGGGFDDEDGDEGAFVEAEGGGLAVDEEQRAALAAKIEVSQSAELGKPHGLIQPTRLPVSSDQPIMTYQGTHGFK